jgi:hypothetical protein
VKASETSIETERAGSGKSPTRMFGIFSAGSVAGVDRTLFAGFCAREDDERVGGTCNSGSGAVGSAVADNRHTPHNRSRHRIRQSVLIGCRDKSHSVPGVAMFACALQSHGAGFERILSIVSQP